ncbi:hypothetical protein [Actinomadura sp. 9N407]|uniref:hypothetical protein n=1 Tax=Actinomadura sp. 9N407 TaxID=3375154 RepID=UPI0037988B50
MGVDRHPFRYYRTEYAVERFIEGSGLPYSILRATQFHELIAQVLGAAAAVPGGDAAAGRLSLSAG